MHFNFFGVASISTINIILKEHDEARRPARPSEPRLRCSEQTYIDSSRPIWTVADLYRQ
jgi:hypothetical protein